MSGERALLEQLLASPVRGELLLLFHRNPGLIDTVEGVARRIGRTPNQIEADLNAFEQLGLLRRRSFGGPQAISLNRMKDRELQAAVTGFLEKTQGERGNE